MDRECTNQGQHERDSYTSPLISRAFIIIYVQNYWLELVDQVKFVYKQKSPEVSET